MPLALTVPPSVNRQNRHLPNHDTLQPQSGRCLSKLKKTHLKSRAFNFHVHPKRHLSVHPYFKREFPQTMSHIVYSRKSSCLWCKQTVYEVKVTECSSKHKYYILATVTIYLVVLVPLSKLKYREWLLAVNADAYESHKDTFIARYQKISMT